MIGFFVGIVNTLFVSKMFTRKYLDEGNTTKYIGMTLLITIPLNLIVLLLIALLRGSV